MDALRIIDLGDAAAAATILVLVVLAAARRTANLVARRGHHDVRRSFPGHPQMCPEPSRSQEAAESVSVLVSGMPSVVASVTLPADGGEIFLGRRHQHDLEQVSTVSETHCRMEVVGGRWRVNDVTSRNGLFVNGQRVTERELSPGDVIRLGRMGPCFVLAEGSDGAPLVRCRDC